jgi:hypothetical protein
MNSEIFRRLADAIAVHLPHLRIEQVRRTDDEIVARVQAADRDNATPVIIAFTAPEPAPVPEQGRRTATDWRHQGDPPGTVFVDRSGHTPTRNGGWLEYPLSSAGDHFAGAPIARQWGAYKPDGGRLATLADLPEVVRFLREGGVLIVTWRELDALKRAFAAMRAT